MTGEYSHVIDEKGRLFVPADFRELLGGKFKLTKGVGLGRDEYCLSAYSEEQWDILVRKIMSLPSQKSNMLRYHFVAPKKDVEMDNQGRILIPAKLREYARLEKNLVVVGMVDHMEIWAEEEWNRMNVTVSNVAELMNEAGI